MWDKLYYGNSLRDWGISLLIIVGALIINKLISIINRRVVRRIAERSRTRIDDLISEALEPPILLGVMLFAVWISLGRLDLGVKFHHFLRNAYEVLVTLNITWLFARVFARMTELILIKSDGSATTRLNISTHLIPLIKRGILIVVWTIGIIMALHNVGVTATTLMGTLGIGGMAFALASQDTIKNIFGGITIFTDQMFQIGDIIRIGDTEGTVVDVGLRSTRLRTYDHRLVILPNSKLIDAVVTNISSEPGRPIVIDLGLTCDTSPEKMRQAMAILSSIDDRVHGVEPGSIIASFVAFADSSLTIRLIYFIRKSANILGTQTEVNLDILSQFNAAGLNFAFPTRTIYIDKGSDLS
mgnify:FL=1